MSSFLQLHLWYSHPILSIVTQLKCLFCGGAMLGLTGAMRRMLIIYLIKHPGEIYTDNDGLWRSHLESSVFCGCHNAIEGMGWVADIDFAGLPDRVRRLEPYLREFRVAPGSYPLIDDITATLKARTRRGSVLQPGPEAQVRFAPQS